MKKEKLSIEIFVPYRSERYQFDKFRIVLVYESSNVIFCIGDETSYIYFVFIFISFTIS